MRLVLCSALSRAGHGVLVQRAQALLDKPVLAQGLNHQWSLEFQAQLLREALGSLQVSLHLGQVCYSRYGCSWTQNFQLWAPLQTGQEEDRRKNSMLRVQNLPESPGRAGVGAGSESPSPVFEDFLSSVSVEGDGRAQAQRHQIKGKSSMLCEKALFLHIRNLWRKRPFSKAWKPFELLIEWQIHLIVKAGEPTSDHYPDPPSLTWGQTSDFTNS